MSYTGFRLTGRNAVVVRPADKTQIVGGDTWAQDRSSAAADDGTEIDATWVNRIKANLEAAVVALGGSLADGNDQVKNALQAALALKAALASPVFTGQPRAPTPATGVTSTEIATAAWVIAKLASLTGEANGLAPLDGSGKVATAYLPSYVDDVVEAANAAALPDPGEAGKIYVTLDDGKTFRWSGSAYTQIAAGDVNSVAGLVGVITAAGLKTALSIAIADVASLQSALDGKAATDHNQAIGTVTGLQTALDAKLDGDDIGVSVQAYDADTLKADTADTLNAGFTQPSVSLGTLTTGTLTLNPLTSSNFVHYINGGAHTLAPPAAHCTMVVIITNNASAGAITLSGWGEALGAADLTTTDGDKFRCRVTVDHGGSEIDIRKIA